jgi:adenosine kinase
MSILVSGSVAFDTIISVVGTFKSQIIPDALDSFNMSLFVPTIRREYGGAAGNIAYNLSLLGKSSEIIAAVGEDAEGYLLRLAELGIRTDSIRVIPQTFSPQGYIIGDEIGRQITAFHPGAMGFS